MTSQRAEAVDEPAAQDVPGMGDVLRTAGVREIMLIHGTFAGNDVAGLLRSFSRFSPGLMRTMKDLGKHWFDQLADEVGNYTEGFASRLASMLAPDSADESNLPERDVKVRRFHWSGENHHLGRACAAVSLLQTILDRQWSSSDRLLFFAHSHGGNILAMMTLLISGGRSAREAFFHALRHHHRNGPSGPDHLPDWSELRDRLDDPDLPSRLPAFDFATFGTPLRYRWALRENDRLLHFVQHRPLIPDQPWRAAIPKSVAEVKDAVGGDYVQQVGIGGTDFPLTIFTWNSWRADRALRRIFEPAVRIRDLRESLLRGERVSLDGLTLLVDYPSTEPPWNEKLLGHGVYTCSPWLPFHLQMIATEFYAEARGPARTDPS